MRTYMFQMEGAQGDDEMSTIKLWTAAQATIGALRPGEQWEKKSATGRW